MCCWGEHNLSFTSKASVCSSLWLTVLQLRQVIRPYLSSKGLRKHNPMYSGEENEDIYKLASWPTHRAGQPRQTKACTLNAYSKIQVGGVYWGINFNQRMAWLFFQLVEVLPRSLEYPALIKPQISSSVFSTISSTLSHAPKVLCSPNTTGFFTPQQAHTHDFSLTNRPYLSFLGRPFIIEDLAWNLLSIKVILFPARKYWSLLFLCLHNTFYQHML